MIIIIFKGWFAGVNGVCVDAMKNCGGAGALQSNAAASYFVVREQMAGQF
jgi:hypothetical protein